MQLLSITNDILDGLEDLKFPNDVSEEYLNDIVQSGPCLPSFSKLICWLTNQLGEFYSLEEKVNAINSESDIENFIFEVSSFLNELSCPYISITAGSIEDRLNSPEKRLTLIYFLITELQAAKIFFTKVPLIVQEKNVEDTIFPHLKSICMTLNMGKPPDNISVEKFFLGIFHKVEQGRNALTTERFSKPIIKFQLGPRYIEALTNINDALVAEYGMRRKMLLKRADVTIASFNWSDRAKVKKEKIAKIYKPLRERISPDSDISIAHLLAAREDLSQQSKTASGSTRYTCAINNVVIGKVPDRGGRPSEVEPPPPEMPSWQKRDNSSGGGSYGGRGRGGGRGGGRGDFRGGNRHGNRGGSGGGYQNQNSSGRPQTAGGHGGGYQNQNHRGRPQTAGYHQQPGNYHQGGGYQQQNSYQQQGQGGRGGYQQQNSHQQQGQGGRGQSRWSRGRGNYGAKQDSFGQTFGRGGQSYSQGGFAQGRNTYQS